MCEEDAGAGHIVVASLALTLALLRAAASIRAGRHGVYKEDRGAGHSVCCLPCLTLALVQTSVWMDVGAGDCVRQGWSVQAECTDAKWTTCQVHSNHGMMTADIQESHCLSICGTVWMLAQHCGDRHWIHQHRMHAAVTLATGVAKLTSHGATPRSLAGT